jgi:phage terminase large subunit-like protein
MPIFDQLPVREKQERLVLLIEEAKSRGLKIPNIDREVHFPVDSNGFFSKEDGRRFELSNTESIRFIESNAVLAALISGRGASKTASGSQKALRKIARGESGAIFNPRFEDLKTSTWAEFRQWVPWNTVVLRHKYRGLPEWEPTQPFKLNFLNGAEVSFKGLKDPDSARGPNINWLWYDEAGTDPDGLAWQIALASVRVGDDIQAWITTTPKGRQHWIYKFFVQKDIPEDAKEAFEEACGDREFIEMFHMSIYDNKDNLHPVYFANLLAAYPTGWLREQEIFGRMRVGHLATESGSLERFYRIHRIL